ncbi:MAG: calcium-binding protein [Cyanobacteria bacterium P01_H01_bin.15]
MAEFVGDNVDDSVEGVYTAEGTDGTTYQVSGENLRSVHLKGPGYDFENLDSEGNPTLDEGGDGMLIVMGDSETSAQGSAGNDIISGQGGDDTASGNAGDDQINGNGGDDTLEGNAGDDTINGGRGNDFINGGADDDFMFGGDDSDTIVGDDALFEPIANIQWGISRKTQQILFENFEIVERDKSIHKTIRQEGSAQAGQTDVYDNFLRIEGLSESGDAVTSINKGGSGVGVDTIGDDDESQKTISHDESLSFFINGELDGTFYNAFNEIRLGFKFYDTDGNEIDPSLVDRDLVELTFLRDNRQVGSLTLDNIDLMNRKDPQVVWRMDNFELVEAADTVLISSATPDVELGLRSFNVAAGVSRDNEGGDDTLKGDEGADNLFGLGGDDSILGGSSSDYIAGGEGSDNLTGGTGADIFAWNTVAEVTSAPDVITDFHISDVDGDIFDFEGVIDELGLSGSHLSLFSDGILGVDLRGAGDASGGFTLTFTAGSISANVADVLYRDNPAFPPDGNVVDALTALGNGNASADLALLDSVLLA